jgi:23S rRNA pseudouridine1911/1915/1917 synthase
MTAMNDVASRILYEDNHIIVVNKAPGELSQGDKSDDRTLADDIKDYLKEKYSKPGNVFLGIVHRLDRPTSGAIVYAKTDKALGRLNEEFRNGTARKTYWAVTDALPNGKEEGLLVHYLVRNSDNNTSRALLQARPDAQEARMAYKCIGASKSFFLLEIELLTGRHHQIRAQLQRCNVHVRGDLKYGFPRSLENGGIDLHARKLELVHPVTKENLTIVAPTPQNDPVWSYFDLQL